MLIWAEQLNTGPEPWNFKFHKALFLKATS